MAGAKNYHVETADSIPTFENCAGRQYQAHIRVKNTHVGDQYYGHTVSKIDNIRIGLPTRLPRPDQTAEQSEHTGDLDILVPRMQFYHPEPVCRGQVIQILRNNFQILYISPIYDWKKMEYNKGRKRGDRNGQLENGVPAWAIRRRNPESTAHAEGGALSFLPEKRRDRRGRERPCQMAGPFPL